MSFTPLLDSSDAEPKAEGRLSCDDDLHCDDKGEGRSDDVFLVNVL